LPEDQVPTLRVALEVAGYPVVAIGRVVEAGQGIWAVRGGQRQPLLRFSVDEIARLF
jgi:hypothetical protein